jgi:hypothetical protein
LQQQAAGFFSDQAEPKARGDPNQGYGGNDKIKSADHENLLAMNVRTV